MSILFESLLGLSQSTDSREAMNGNLNAAIVRLGAVTADMILPRTLLGSQTAMEVFISIQIMCGWIRPRKVRSSYW